MENKIFIEGVTALDKGVLCVAETTQGIIQFRGIAPSPSEFVIFTIVDGIIKAVNYCEKLSYSILPPNSIYGKQFPSTELGGRLFFQMDRTRWTSPSEKSEITGLVYPVIRLYTVSQYDYIDDTYVGEYWVLNTIDRYLTSSVFTEEKDPFEIEGVTIDLINGKIKGKVSPKSEIFENYYGGVIFRKNLIPTRVIPPCAERVY